MMMAYLSFMDLKPWEKHGGCLKVLLRTVSNLTKLLDIHTVKKMIGLLLG